MRWLKAQLTQDLKLKPQQIEILDGQMSDTEQNNLVDRFGRQEDPIRILLCSDVASEGLNLHYFCHRLVHFDLPFSLMVFQQRNGRVDRYGQKHRPHIVYLFTEAQTDQVQLEAHDWLPGPDHQDAPERAYMQAWADNMTQALAQTAGAKAGIFNPACYIHTSFGLTGPLLSGENYLEAFARWYFGGEDVRLADDCGVTCNPTCPH